MDSIGKYYDRYRSKNCLGLLSKRGVLIAGRSSLIKWIDYSFKKIDQENNVGKGTWTM